MCGIVGYVGRRDGKPIILDGLRRLEYRGYDSAGIVLLEGDGIKTVRAVGNIDALVAAAGPDGSAAATSASRLPTARTVVSSPSSMRTMPAES